MRKARPLLQVPEQTLVFLCAIETRLINVPQYLSVQAPVAAALLDLSL